MAYSPKRKRKRLNITHREALYKRSHGRCWYCGVQIGKKAFRLDHQVSFSKEGADSKRNLVVACECCDGLKKAQTVAEFREFLSALTMEPVVVFHGERQEGGWNWKGRITTGEIE